MATGDRDLVLSRLLKARRENIYRAWTEPELLKRWFTPAPYSTIHAELDVAPGGANLVIMADPDGTPLPPNRGVYLEVVRNERLVFTDAYVSAWEPAEKPFMTVTLTLADEAGGTRYIARVSHWTVEDRKMHEDMGFHAGWGKATDQLEALAASL
ncbi:SRPBCC family protein [Zavarzinia compransoris]|uniref:Polyketide cyclase n=1 Tax=Zavarzinia compransoris TaxID=1264899 RepID=A0A317DZ14_9PROT|nr:SRPBCC family protein [Zavarzinia compransoris]PWR19116.1 polyketide cyclase [Zavarzinia compransoris]TDP49126.1 uncharacterized protein YndB with AHSA1/START domain [Zavarzinia compransoris]